MADTTFVNGTTLSDADWFNDVNRLHYTIFGDPANLAAVKSLLGTGGMTFTGPTLHADGTQAAPGIAWANEGSTGWRRASPGTTVYVVGGVDLFGLNATSATANTQVIINMGYSGTAAQIGNASLVINGTGGLSPGLSMHMPGVAQWQEFVYPNAAIVWATSGLLGPTSLGGFAMTLATNGVVQARAFNTMSFAATNVRPMTGALADTLKLHGVRCFNEETQREDITIAVEDVELAFPELINTFAATETAPPAKGINYMALAAPIIEAIRELHNRVTALENA